MLLYSLVAKPGRICESSYCFTFTERLTVCFSSGTAEETEARAEEKAELSDNVSEATCDATDATGLVTTPDSIVVVFIAEAKVKLDDDRVLASALVMTEDVTLREEALDFIAEMSSSSEYVVVTLGTTSWSHGI